MGFLEDRFRRQFEPHGDLYLFRQVGREVLFDREDVELFVRGWRRYWASPLLWGALLGAVAVALAYRFGGIETGLDYVFVLVPLTIVSCLVCLWVSARAPAEAAANLPSVGPGTRRPAHWGSLYGLVLALLWLGIVRPDGYWGNWPYWVWGGVALFHALRLIRIAFKRPPSSAA